MAKRLGMKFRQSRTFRNFTLYMVVVSQNPAFKELRDVTCPRCRLFIQVERYPPEIRLFLNATKVDFGKLLGVYVVLFFIVAQIVAKLQFNQSPSKPIWAGGTFVVVGGLIMTLWKAS